MLTLLSGPPVSAECFSNQNPGLNIPSCQVIVETLEGNHPPGSIVAIRPGSCLCSLALDHIASRTKLNFLVKYFRYCLYTAQLYLEFIEWAASIALNRIWPVMFWAGATLAGGGASIWS